MAFTSQFIPASELQDFLATARKRYAYGLAVDAEDRAEAQDDARFILGGLRQWDAASIESRSNPTYPRPILTENRIHVFAQQVINDGRQSKPSIVITAGDTGQPETAEVIQSWIRQIEYESDADVAYDTAREHQIISGRGWYRLGTKFKHRRPTRSAGKLSDQVPVFEAIPNQFSVVWEPAAREYDKSDADWMFCVSVISKDQHKRDYGESELTGASFVAGADQNLWVNLGPQGEDILKAEYWVRKHKKRILCQLQDGAIVWKDELVEPDTPMRDGTIASEYTIVEEREEDDVTVRQFIIDAVGILDETEWTGDEIPLIPEWGLQSIVDGKLHTCGLIRPGKTPQRLINLTVSNIAELTAQIPKNPYVVAEGQILNHEQEWETMNTVPRPYIQYKQVAIGGTLAPPPQRVVSEPPIQALIALLNQSTDALKASMGIFDASLGARSNETSGIAIQQRRREADNANFHFHDNEARSRKCAGRKLLYLLANLNQGATVITVRSEDGKTKQVPINQEFEDTESGKTLIHFIDPEAYGVSVSTGPSQTSARREAFDKYSQIATADPRFMAVAGDVLFRNMDAPGADQIADRYEKTLPPGLQPQKEGDPQPLPQEITQQMEQGKQIITRLTEELHAAKDQLDSKQPEISARTKIAEMQEETKRLQIQAELDIAKLNAGVKTAIAELQEDMAGLKHSIDTAHGDAAAERNQIAAAVEAPPAEKSSEPPLETPATETEQGVAQ